MPVCGSEYGHGLLIDKANVDVTIDNSVVAVVLTALSLSLADTGWNEFRSCADPLNLINFALPCVAIPRSSYFVACLLNRMSRSLIPSSLSLSLRSEFFAPFGGCLIEFLALGSLGQVRRPNSASSTPTSARLPTSTTEQKDDDTATPSSTATCATQEAMSLTEESSEKTATTKTIPPVSSAKRPLPTPTPSYRLKVTQARLLAELREDWWWLLSWLRAATNDAPAPTIRRSSIPSLGHDHASRGLRAGLSPASILGLSHPGAISFHARLPSFTRAFHRPTASIIDAGIGQYDNLGCYRGYAPETPPVASPLRPMLVPSPRAKRESHRAGHDGARPVSVVYEDNAYAGM
ncbi:hypothetical protein C8J56DRAFT_1063321 [Mycena floridula]|nr:hypothetical protein C8J56DRAFT_1063321 [Mycena floridula]